MSSRFTFKISLISFGVIWFLFLLYLMRGIKYQPPDKREFDYASQDFASRPLMHKLSFKILGGRRTSYNSSFHGSSNGALPTGLSVVISGNSSSLMGVIATMNSIVTNTKGRDSLKFFVTLPQRNVSFLKQCLGNSSRLNTMKVSIRPHPPTVPADTPQFTKIFLLHIFPEITGLFLYIGPHVIVQGDLSELLTLPQKEGAIAYMSNNCLSSVSKDRYYVSHLNFKHNAIKSSGVSPRSCSFNTDVFLANATSWRLNKVEKLFRHWLKLHRKRPPIQKMHSSIDIASTILLIILYKRIENFPPSWQVLKLGTESSYSMSQEFITKAKLLHWSGPLKPWDKAPYKNIWSKYFKPESVQWSRLS